MDIGEGSNCIGIRYISSLVGGRKGGGSATGKKSHRGFVLH